MTSLSTVMGGVSARRELTVQCISIYGNNIIRLQAQVFYEQIVNKGQPHLLLLIENVSKLSNVLVETQKDCSPKLTISCNFEPKIKNNCSSKE